MPDDDQFPQDSMRHFSVAQRMLGGSRWVIFFAVVGTFLSAMTLLLYSVGVVIKTIWDLLTGLHFSEKEAKALSLTFISMIDLFLLGTVIYIISLGLYELFVDDDLPMPRWLKIDSIEALKEKLLGVVIVLLGVTFLGNVMSWTGGTDIFYLGTGIALVIISLVAAMKFTPHHAPEHKPDDLHKHE
jgi:uncharacterized membrane protein YqhA